MGDVRSKTTFGKSCAGADALGGGRGGFRRSKTAPEDAARGQVYFVCIRNLLKLDQILIRQED